MKMLKLTLVVLAIASVVVWGLYFAARLSRTGKGKSASCKVEPYPPGAIEFASAHGNRRLLFRSAREVRASALLVGEKEYCLWAEPILRFSNGNKVTYVEAWPVVHMLYYRGFQNESKIESRNPNLVKDLEAKNDEFLKTIDDMFRVGYRCDTFPKTKDGDQVWCEIDAFIIDVLADGMRPALVQGYFLSLRCRMTDEIIAHDAIEEVLNVEKAILRKALNKQVASSKPEHREVVQEEKAEEEEVEEEETDQPEEAAGRDRSYDTTCVGPLQAVIDVARMNQLNRYADCGEWDRAEEAAYGLANLPSGADTKIMYGVMLAMASWNAGNVEGATTAMDCVISICRQIGCGCEANAVKLRNAFAARRITGSFNKKEFNNVKVGMLGLVYGPPAQILGNRRASVIAYADSEARKARFEGSMYESKVKREANAEYRRVTKSDFDPDRPPKKGSWKREQWDYAKRIHDIFD